MPHEIEVDVPGVIQGARAIGYRAAELAASNTRTSASITDARSGWVGSSAQSLASMAAKLDRISARHGKAVETHVRNMDAAAKLFADMEAQHAQKMKEITQQARDVAL